MQNEPETPATFSQRIRKLREQHGWSQQEMSEACGIPQRTISDWEKGNLDDNMVRIVDLAKALKTTAGDLLGDAALPRLMPGLYLVDVDVWEKMLPPRDGWALELPKRPRIVDRDELAKMKKDFRRRVREKRKGR